MTHCPECKGRLLGVSSGAVCENGCGRIFSGVELPPGREIKQSPFKSIGRLLAKVEADWEEGPLPARLEPVTRFKPRVRSLPTKGESIRKVKKQMAKLGVTLEDLAGGPKANGNGHAKPANTRWQRINGAWYQIPKGNT